MNSDYLLQAAGPHSRGLRLSLPLTTAVGRHLETRRTGLPASHAGVADVPSTPEPAFCSGVDHQDYREPSALPLNLLFANLPPSHVRSQPQNPAFRTL